MVAHINTLTKYNWSILKASHFRTGFFQGNLRSGKCPLVIWEPGGFVRSCYDFFWARYDASNNLHYNMLIYGQTADQWILLVGVLYSELGMSNNIWERQSTIPPALGDIAYQASRLTNFILTRGESQYTRVPLPLARDIGTHPLSAGVDANLVINIECAWLTRWIQGDSRVYWGQQPFM